MSESEILEKLRQAFTAAWIGLEADLQRDLAFEDIDGLDSISRVRLMLSVEQGFGIEVSPREHGRLKSIGDLVDLIQAKRSGPKEITAIDSRQRCLMILSCLGVYPNYFLRLSDDFQKRYQLVVYQMHSAEAITDQMLYCRDEIHNCDAFIYHSPDWMPFLGERREAYDELGVSRIARAVVQLVTPAARMLG